MEAMPSSQVPPDPVETPPQTKSFLELAPEIRNQIYRYLFRGLKVKIRKQDYMDTRERDRNRVTLAEAARQRIIRDRANGFNIILTCKTVFTEAKPFLLSTAEFDIDFRIWLSKRAEVSTFRCQQGFTQNDLESICSLEIHQYPRRNASAANEALLAMPRLSKLTVLNIDVVSKANFSLQAWKQQMSFEVWNLKIAPQAIFPRLEADKKMRWPLAVLGIDLWSLYAIQPVARRLRRAALAAREIREYTKQFQCVYKHRLVLENADAIVCLDLINDNAWVVKRHNQGEWLYPTKTGTTFRINLGALFDL